MIEYVAVVIIFLGSVMSVISAFGIIRLPDVYTRSHAATKSSTVAVLLSSLEPLYIFGLVRIYKRSSYTRYIICIFNCPCLRALTYPGSVSFKSEAYGKFF